MRIVNLADCPHTIPTLAQWHHEQWGDLNPQRTLEARVEKFQNHLEQDGIPTTFVAMNGDTLLGSASLVECDLHQRSDLSPWLASVFVAPEFRGRDVPGPDRAAPPRAHQYADAAPDGHRRLRDV